MTIARMRAGAGDRSCWSTPSWLFHHYNRRLDFTLDAAAEQWNAKCFRFFSPEDDALQREWTGRVWCNPPYAEIAPWVARAHEMTRVHRLADVAVLLLPVRTSRPWFQECVLPFAHVEWLDQRVCFDPPPGWTGKRDSPAEDSMIVTFERPWMPRGRKEQRAAGAGVGA